MSGDREALVQNPASTESAIAIDDHLNHLDGPKRQGRLIIWFPYKMCLFRMVNNSDEGPRAADMASSRMQSDARRVDPVAGKTVAEILGEIVWLMTQDPAGREMKVAEIEALVMPAILARRFHIKYAQVPDMRRSGATTLQPVEVNIFSQVLPGTGEPATLARFSLNPLKKSPSQDVEA